MEAIDPADVIPGRAELSAAMERLAGKVRRTPTLDLPAGDLSSVPVTLKLEMLQHTGAFKARGALNAVLTAPAGTRSVCAASGGNHGAAVAWAAGRAGLPAHVFVPATVPAAKAALIEGYGATLHRVDGFYADAWAASLAHAQQHGAHHVDAYDAAAVVAGQSTLGQELAEQVEPGRAVLVGCGGGGLFSGVSLALEGRNPVVAVEPATAPTLTRALEAGQVVDVDVSGVAVDSLGARRAGDIATAVAQRLGSTSILVSDEAIVQAQQYLWSNLRLAVEPGGATALASVLSGQARYGNPVVVLSGANGPVLR
ncbi:serine/threonine dehydratase [Kineosporia sp. NBRC 101731]|uniref:serine/threonine dehydratase n=1 Tax=Kineosporia sp. NBRC 101731 TaxID=3032199 RepID=UPI0024A084DE|nr:serine/threonine dehydratase [Kineosporia sp. NBRC 101731]GLY30987.1 threonine dehydratase [Kineosporia sp. NBRC 101731]